MARTLRSLPEIRQAFRRGFAYVRTREITRIATVETEGKWLAFANEVSLFQLKVEVADALETGRKEPRDKASVYGLPAATRMRLPFDFSPAEYEVVDQALRKVGKELSLSVGGGEVDLKAALLFWLKRALETDPGSTPEGRIEREESVYTVLYHRCRDCQRSQVLTEDGPVEVPNEVVERVEKTAVKVEILPEEEKPQAPLAQEGPVGDSPPARDAHHTPEFLRRLFLRDGARCLNPMCRRKVHLTGHHLKPWSQGGRTAFSNEGTLCAVCHSAVELGLLTMEGDPTNGFTFRSRADEIHEAMYGELARQSDDADSLARPFAEETLQALRT